MAEPDPWVQVGPDVSGLHDRQYLQNKLLPSALIAQFAVNAKPVPAGASSRQSWPSAAPPWCICSLHPFGLTGHMARERDPAERHPGGADSYLASKAPWSSRPSSRPPAARHHHRHCGLGRWLVPPCFRPFRRWRSSARPQPRIATAVLAWFLEGSRLKAPAGRLPRDAQLADTHNR